LAAPCAAVALRLELDYDLHASSLVSGWVL